MAAATASGGEAVSGALTRRQDDGGACGCWHPGTREEGRHDTDGDEAEEEEKAEDPNKMLEVQLTMQKSNVRTMIGTGPSSPWNVMNTFLQSGGKNFVSDGHGARAVNGKAVEALGHGFITVQLWGQRIVPERVYISYLQV